MTQIVLSESLLTTMASDDLGKVLKEEKIMRKNTLTIRPKASYGRDDVGELPDALRNSLVKLSPWGDLVGGRRLLPTYSKVKMDYKAAFLFIVYPKLRKTEFKTRSVFWAEALCGVGV